MAVDAATAAAARDGIVTIVLDRQSITGRVVATLPRFPTTAPGRFAVVDVAALGRLVDLGNPGAGQPTEVWLAARPGAADAAFTDSLTAAPLDRLAVSERAVIERTLRTDPVARAAVGLLLAAVGVMLALAVVALVLLVHTERQDDAGQLHAWEADGVAPRTLRASLWWRAVAVAVPAVPVGVVTGVALSRLTARLVAVTATATTPEPPLVPGVGIGRALLAVVIGVVLTLAVAAVVASFALREPMPVAPDGAVAR
jgi:hypothetical protein